MSDVAQNAAPPADSTFFDGASSRRRVVTLDLEPTLAILEDGVAIAEWPYKSVRRISADNGLLRLKSVGAPELARLELRDPALQARLVALCPKIGEAASPDVSTRAVVFWSLAAIASILGLVFFAIPHAAKTIADHFPDTLERRLGRIAEGQVVRLFPGQQCTAPKGVAALQKLSKKLQDAADLRLPAEMVAISSGVPNAFALPGGRVFLFSGLLAKAQNQDEIAGVLAHELGHLQHRDHVRRMVENGGGAYLIGLLFGDVKGGGALVFLGKQMFFAAHSREAEAAADVFAAQTLAKLGRPAKPLGELLERVTGPEEDGAFTILHDHPLSKERLAALAAAGTRATGLPLLTDEEWRALKSICGGVETQPKGVAVDPVQLTDAYRQAAPLGWAAAWNQQGLALKRQGDRENSLAHYQQAAAAY